MPALTTRNLPTIEEAAIYVKALTVCQVFIYWDDHIGGIQEFRRALPGVMIDLLFEQGKTLLDIDGDFAEAVVRKVTEKDPTPYYTTEIPAMPTVSSQGRFRNISWGAGWVQLKVGEYYSLEHYANGNLPVMAVMAMATRSQLCMASRFDIHASNYPLAMEVGTSIPSHNSGVFGMIPGIGPSADGFHLTMDDYLISPPMTDASVRRALRWANSVFHNHPDKMVIVLLPVWDDIGELIRNELTECQWEFINPGRTGRPSRGIKITAPDAT